MAQAMILCGGMGTRLGPLTAHTPKPLLKVGERPFLDVLLFQLARHGFQEVVLLASFQSTTVLEYVAANEVSRRFDMRIDVCVEGEPRGTGGAVQNARHLARETFLLLNGDSWFDMNLLALEQAAGIDHASTCTMALRRIDNASRFGTVTMKGTQVAEFSHRPLGEGPGLVNAGIYACKSSIFDWLESSCSLEINVLPRLAGNRLLSGYEASGYFTDIGVPSSFEAAQYEVPAKLRRPAIFLDRDGVINHDFGYVAEIERFVWIDGAIDAIRALNDAGYYVFVVTNQSGVARGLYKEQDVQALHGWMQVEMRKAGAHIDDFRYCPYHVDGVMASYRKASNWRKPEPGMLLDLGTVWPIDMSKSHVVGDKDSDLAAGKSLGLESHLFTGGNLHQFLLAKQVL